MEDTVDDSVEGASCRGSDFFSQIIGNCWMFSVWHRSSGWQGVDDSVFFRIIRQRVPRCVWTCSCVWSHVWIQTQQEMRVRARWHRQITVEHLYRHITVEANPTVRGIHHCSEQSFQPHHPGVSETPTLSIFFFYKFIGKMLYFSGKKGIIHSHRDLNSVSSSTDKTNLLGPIPSRLRSPAPRVQGSSCLKWWRKHLALPWAWNQRHATRWSWSA
jgi:hypothetical protein